MQQSPAVWLDTDNFPSAGFPGGQLGPLLGLPGSTHMGKGVGSPPAGSSP